MITLVLGILGIIVITLLLIGWIIFSKWTSRNTESKEEKKSMQRWFRIVLLLGVFGVGTQWIMFLPAWYFRNKKKRYFSWWLDNSRFGDYKGSIYAKDYFIHLDGRKETFWIAYWWHLRNMVWNLQNKKIFKVKPQTIKEGNQNIKITRVIEDTIQKKDGTKLVVDGIYGQFAGLKYWKNGKSTWDTMNGEQISAEKSILGTGFYFYNNNDQPLDDNQLNWTYTSCELAPFLFFWKRWRTIQLGMKQKGYSRQFKYQRQKPWK